MKAARSALQEIRRNHEQERLYALGLTTNGEASFILATGNTEEAIREHFGRRVEPDEEPWLRWYPSEWVCQYEGREHFAAVQQVLDEFDPYADDLSIEEASAHIERINDCCIRVMRELDEEGAFGRSTAREQVVVNLWRGDQSDEERIALSKQLNPESVWRRFEAELAAAASVWERKCQAGLYG